MNKIRERIDQYDQGVILNYLFRILGMGLSFFSFRLIISYLGASLYGIWATLISITAWMGIGDLGIGNGVRNQIAKAYGDGDFEKEKKIIASGIASLGKIAIVLFFLLCILSEIFIYTNILSNIVRIPMYISGAFFCFNLYLGLASSIAFAHQKSWYVTAGNTFSVFLQILFIYMFKICGVEANLIPFSVVQGICLVCPNLIMIFVLEKNGICFWKCRIHENYDKGLVKDIVTVGLGFFCLQICSVVLNSTDNLIIYALFDEESVTRYSAITKIYDTGQSLFAVLLIPLWSAVTYQAARENYKWIAKETKKLVMLWGLYSTGVFVISLLLNLIVKVWLGKEAFYYERSIVMLFCFYGIFAALSTIFANVLNGLGEIKLQLIVAIIGALVNIPLSIVLGKYCGMGIAGIKLATFFTIFAAAIILPIHVMVILTKKCRNHQ